MKSAALWIVRLGAVATLGFMLYAGEPHRLVWWGLFAVFGAWALLPYLVLHRRLRGTDGPKLVHGVLLVAALLLTGFGFAVFLSAFFLEPDAQSGLVVLFIPIWQWVGLIIAFWVAGRLERSGQGVAQ